MTKLERLLTEFRAGLIPVFTKRQNSFLLADRIHTLEPEAQLGMEGCIAFCCSLLVLCHCYPRQGLMKKEGGVVQNNISKMCIYGLYVYLMLNRVFSCATTNAINITQMNPNVRYTVLAETVTFQLNKF